MKSSYLMEMAQCLRDKYDCDIPKTFEDLCDLKGVGPKMACLTLSMALNMYVQFLCSVFT